MFRASYPDADYALQAKCSVEENHVHGKRVWNQTIWLPLAINFNESPQELSQTAAIVYLHLFNSKRIFSFLYCF
jgi:hypothetical protein